MSPLLLLPPDIAIIEQGYGKTFRKVKEIAHSLEAINEDRITEIAREVRRRIYVLGLDGGYDGIQKQANISARWEQVNVDSLQDPLSQETSDAYTQRLRKWRTFFAIRALSFLDDKKVESIIGDVNARFRREPQPESVAEKVFNAAGDDIIIEINDRTPEDILMDIIAFTENDQFKAYESEGKKFNPGLIKAIRRNAHASLIRRYITTDQGFIETASRFFRYYHYEEILHRSPGALSEGKIGLKAAGMILAYAVLTTDMPEFDNRFADLHNLAKSRPEDLIKAGKVLDNYKKLSPAQKAARRDEYLDAQRIIDDHQKLSLARLKETVGECLEENNSFFIGSTILKDLISENPPLSLLTVAKYHDDEFLESEQNMEDIKTRLIAAEFPPHLLRQLKDFYDSLAEKANGAPLIVRSSSALEDKMGASFAGMYDSVICPSDDFEAFLGAIKQVYISVFQSKVIKYRKKHGLLDYDEGMSLLVQKLNGGWYGKYFMPDFAGVCLSHAPQSPGPDPTRGSMTLVMGLGEQVVEKGGKIIWFAQPQLNFREGSRANYVQEKVCVWDKKTATVRYVETAELIGQDQGTFNSPSARDIFSGREGMPIQSRMCKGEVYRPDFKGLTQNNPATLPLTLEYLTKKLEYALGHKVDIEFTARKTEEQKYKVRVVQCRPQNIAENLKPAYVPEHVPDERKLLESNSSLSNGHATNIQYVLYIPEEVYGSGHPDCLSHEEMNQLRQWIARINALMAEKGYMIVAPGRWGDNQDSELGVYVTAGDYDKTAAVVEVVGNGHWQDIPPSAGSHDYQLIVEKGILTVSIDSKSDKMQTRQFESVPNRIKDLPGMEKIPERIAKWLKLVSAEDIGKDLTGKTEKWRIHIAANNTDSQVATVYLAKENLSKPKIGEL